jgi:hypothetical protein
MCWCSCDPFGHLGQNMCTREPCELGCEFVIVIRVSIMVSLYDILLWVNMDRNWLSG